MKTIFDGNAREELIARIATLNEGSAARWGKMDLSQMLKHCILFDEWILGVNSPVYRQSFLGMIFGKMALKSTMKDEPMKRRMPAGAGFVVKEKSGNIGLDKARWIGLISGYGHFSNPGFIHDFFGKMTQEQIGILAYKHTDHHLRQFNG